MPATEPRRVFVGEKDRTGPVVRRRSGGGWSVDLGGGVDEPELLADELFLLLEGAHVSAQSLGPRGPASRLVRMGEALIAAHRPAG